MKLKLECFALSSLLKLLDEPSSVGGEPVKRNDNPNVRAMIAKENTVKIAYMQMQ